MEDAGLNPVTPNVLLICTDQLRGDWLGCNGHPVVMTPQLDALATEGVTFQRAFSECPVCVPARRVIMTGTGPYTIGINRNSSQPFTQGPLLGEVMTGAGYQTFATGKMHTVPQRARLGFEDIRLNEEGRRGPGLPRDDYEAYLEAHGYAHLAFTHGLGNNEYGVRMSPVPEPYTTTHWTGQQAMEFIERRDPTRPFFLYVSFDKPHPPITPPEVYYDLYRDAAFPPPVYGEWVDAKTPSRFEFVRGQHLWETIRDHPLYIQQTLRGYAALVTHIDSIIGVLLGTLREHRLLDNTHILFVSDHGDQLFDHGNFAKSDFLRGATNVPFILRPSLHWLEEHGVEAGQVDTRTPAGLSDVMPTILDGCGVEIPQPVEGQSLLPVIAGEHERFRQYTLGNCGPAYGITDGRLKYTWYGNDGIELLFDLDQDPHELRDLSEDQNHAAELRQLRRRLTEWMAAHDDPRAAGGELVPSGTGSRRFPGFRPTRTWNNRGRH